MTSSNDIGDMTVKQLLQAYKGANKQNATSALEVKHLNRNSPFEVSEKDDAQTTEPLNVDKRNIVAILDSLIAEIGSGSA